MTNKKTITIVITVAMFATAGFLAITSKKSPEVETSLITNFEECKNAGYPVMESYPEQCRDAEGNLFVRIIEETLEDPKDVPIPVTTQKEFNTSITYKIGDSVVFSDGLKVTLKEINDSRCKPDVQCIWAGELSALFSVSGGSLIAKEDVRLGTTNNKSKTLQNYTFTLQSATENT